MKENECFHAEEKQHVLCKSGDLSIEVDKSNGDIIISCRKNKYKPITTKEDEKYIQIVLEKARCFEVTNMNTGGSQEVSISDKEKMLEILSTPGMKVRF